MRLILYKHGTRKSINSINRVYSSSSSKGQLKVFSKIIMLNNNSRIITLYYVLKAKCKKIYHHNNNKLKISSICNKIINNKM